MKYFLILLFLLLFITSCAKLEDVGFEMGQDLGMNLLDEDSQESQVDIFCIQKAQEQRVDQVTLYSISENWFLKNFTFANGVKDKSVSIRYELGDAQGENVGYYYPRNLLEDTYLTYKEEIVQNDIIQGDFTFKMKLILVNTTSEEILVNTTRYGNNIPSKVFDVVRVEYFDCEQP